MFTNMEHRFKNTPRFLSHQNKQICNNEKSDPNSKKLNQKANAKKIN